MRVCAVIQPAQYGIHEAEKISSNLVGKVSPVTLNGHPLNNCLVEVAVRDGAKDADNDAGKYQGSQDRLNENGILNLTKSWLLDPDLAIKDLTNDVAFLVLGNPGLIFEAVRIVGDQALGRHFASLDGVGRFVVGKELPRANVTVV